MVGSARRFRIVYTTYLTGRLNRDYWNKDYDEIPTLILTTHDTPDAWNSLNNYHKFGEFTNKALYKAFSTSPLTEATLDQLFDE